VSSAEGSWPRAAFAPPALRRLDARAQTEIERAGRLLSLRSGETVYRSGDPSDAFYVVIGGNVRVSAVRRGDDKESVVRTARRGDTFGEEAALVGARRWATALTEDDVSLAEIPIGVYTRALARSSAGTDVAEREERALRRIAARDLLSTHAFARDLPEHDIGLLLDAVRWETAPRQSRIYVVGDRADAAYLVVDGLVQLQSELDGRIQVRAYLGRGDFFGDDEALAGSRRALTAAALGDCQLLRVERQVLRTLFDRNPGLVERMRRLATERSELQQQVVGEAAAKTTQHVFHDLYRMQMARSLLAIDQDTCVRCGHCAWACAETHDGVSRLVRRGDKIVTQLALADAHDPRSLMLPNSCQHCRNPACMIDCPTGAIGRDPEGEVFIREALCTGCGACAKACPWDNISMAPRSHGVVVAEPAGPGTSADVAVKCDLCRELTAPACVQSCPTEAIIRLDPQRDFAEVGRLLGQLDPRVEGKAGTDRARVFTLLPLVGVLIAVAFLVVGATLHSRGVWSPGRGIPMFGGWLAAVVMIALTAYAVPKRFLARFVERKKKSSAARRATGSGPSEETARSRLRPHYLIHLALGGLVIAGVALHSGLRMPGTAAGALAAAFWGTVCFGLFGVMCYRVVPARLTRLERKGALPEDLAAERDLLFDRLHRHSSGKSDLLKKIAEKILVPYARSASGPLELLIAGRSLREEETRLKKQVEAVLEGRGAERLEGLDELIRIVVELRALPARRALTLALRGWLPVHVIGTGILFALLGLHILQMTRW
jgi:Fe-S-cluster-containing dehydrogenase component